MIKYYYHHAFVRYLFATLDLINFSRVRPVSAVIKKILLVNLGGIGDVMLMEPMLRRLSELWPSAEIDLLCDTISAPLLSNHPYLNRINIFSLPWLSHSRPSWLSSLWSFSRQVLLLRRQNYDLAFDIKGDPAIILLLALAGVKYRIGFANGGLGALLHQAYDFYAHELPRAQLNYLLLSSFLPDWLSLPAKPQLTLRSEELLWAQSQYQQFCLPDRQTIVIHLSSGQAEKTWPQAKWRQLLSDLGDYNLLIIGSLADSAALAELNNPQLINFLGCDLRLSCALISKADLFVGCDSGPGHLAAALNVPVITIFSLVNNPKVWAADQASLLSHDDVSRIEVDAVKSLVLVKLTSNPVNYDQE